MSLHKPFIQNIPEQNLKYEIAFVNPTLQQVNSPSQSQSISPIRSQPEISLDNKAAFINQTSYRRKEQEDQQIETLRKEIESQTLCIKIKTQQIQELQARKSELELHYVMKQEEIETKYRYQIELTQSQLREKQQENSNLIFEINQLKTQFNKYQLLLEQTSLENTQLREQITYYSHQNLKENQQPTNMRQSKIELTSLQQQMLKQNDVITSLEEQNKYYEEEYNKYINENKNLLAQLQKTDGQFKEYQEELQIIQEQLSQCEKECRQKQCDFEEIAQLNQKKIEQERQETERLTLLLQQKQQEIKNLSNQFQQKLQETSNSQQQLNQQNWKINELEQNSKDLQLMVDHYSTQIAQMRKTISLLEKNLQSTSEIENSYQLLLQNYNSLKEQIKQQTSDIITTTNNQNLQQQLIISQQQAQQQQAKIEKLTTMLKNRLDEIELWKNKCYQMENQEVNKKLKQLIQENDILRQRYLLLTIQVQYFRNQYQGKQQSIILIRNTITKLNCNISSYLDPITIGATLVLLKLKIKKITQQSKKLAILNK